MKIVKTTRALTATTLYGVSFVLILGGMLGVALNQPEEAIGFFITGLLFAMVAGDMQI